MTAIVVKNRTLTIMIFMIYADLIDFLFQNKSYVIIYQMDDDFF